MVFLPPGVQGFRKTGLGNRLAFTMVVAMGRWGAVGLAYGLAAAEALLAPMIPSVAARAGGVILPITVSLAEAAGSRPSDGTEDRLGTRFLPYASTLRSVVRLTPDDHTIAPFAYV